jgi:hypothetical protein
MAVNILKDIPENEIAFLVALDEGAGFKVTKIPQSDGKWTIISVGKRAIIAGQSETGNDTEPVAEEPSAGASPSAVTDDPTIGTLSEQFESRGDPGAIGEDRTGGPSYGSYQIATKTGTMKKFLSFLGQQHPGFAAKLNAAGGNNGALNRTAAFEAGWKDLAKDPAFEKAQHGFIQASHYDPFVSKVRRDNNLDVPSRSLALKNVAWSVSVQHGAGNNVFKNALKNKNPAPADDAVIINDVYNERSKVDKYFSSSSDAVKKSVKKRFAEERADALEMLEKEKIA